MECYNHAQVSLSVSAIGPGTLLYNWKKDGVDIIDHDYKGVHESTLTIWSFSHKHIAKYTCEITYNHKMIESSGAELHLSKYYNFYVSTK